jgi:hypothetical protein
MEKCSRCGSRLQGGRYQVLGRQFCVPCWDEAGGLLHLCDKEKEPVAVARPGLLMVSGEEPD